VGLKPYYLGDTSALARLATAEVAVRLAPLLEAGLVARCTPTDLEAGFSSQNPWLGPPQRKRVHLPGQTRRLSLQNPASHTAMRAERSAWPFVPMDQQVLDRAVDVQDLLGARSQQRGAKIADLLIAAAAEAAGLVVLHYDHDFDLIASVTHQIVEWAVPAGTVD
jgi:predicted nucleic acid-binding protein